LDETSAEAQFLVRALARKALKTSPVIIRRFK